MGPAQPAPSGYSHALAGPPVFQEVISPVSSEVPSRLGPRNCGQSAARLGAETDARHAAINSRGAPVGRRFGGIGVFPREIVMEARRKLAGDGDMFILPWLPG